MEKSKLHEIIEVNIELRAAQIANTHAQIFPGDFWSKMLNVTIFCSGEMEEFHLGHK